MKNIRKLFTLLGVICLGIASAFGALGSPNLLFDVRAFIEQARGIPVDSPPGVQPDQAGEETISERVPKLMGVLYTPGVAQIVPTALYENNIAVIMKPMVAVEKLALFPGFDEEAMRVLSTVTDTYQMVMRWLRYRPPLLGGERIEIYPLVDKKTARIEVLNAYCDNDTKDRDGDGNVKETILKLEWDPNVRDSNGNVFSYMYDHETIAHETGHALFWGMLSTRPDDTKRFGKLNGVQWREFLAIDEATGDITALLFDLQDQKILEAIEDGTQGELKKSNIASRQTEYGREYIITSVKHSYNLDVSYFRGKLVKVLALNLLQNTFESWRSIVSHYLHKHMVSTITGVSETMLLEFFQDIGVARGEDPYRDHPEKFTDASNLIIGVRAKWSFSNRKRPIGEKLRAHNDLLEKVISSLGELMARETPQVLQQTADAFLAIRLKELLDEYTDKGLNRDISQRVVFKNVTYEHHVFSLVLSGSVYAVLVELVNERQLSGLSFKDSVYEAQEIIGSIYFPALASFAYKTIEGAYSMSELLESIVEQAQIVAPTTVPLWIRSFSDRGVTFPSPMSFLSAN